VRIVAVSRVRDEVDVVGWSIRGLLEQGVSHVLVADNASTDGTRDLLADLEREGSVTVFDDPERSHVQARTLTALCERAVERLSARWVVPFDADELWLLPRRLPRLGVGVLHAPIHDHLCTAADDAADPNPFTRMAWRHPPHYQKVVARWRRGWRLEQGSHWVLDAPNHHAPTRAFDGLALHHVPVRSPEQFVRKAMKGKEVLETTGDRLPQGASFHWRAWARIAEGGTDALRAEFRSNPRYFAAEPAPPLVRDPIRWTPQGPRVG
jgi:hypothetical protein